ncbi:MAG: hypothetical protein M0R17_05330 [Candidatus Omnitrophica bacterium]|jgi:hypothetical protein|nr:hypothetical protein [Candidatus Omnitrophota bacterium]
MTINLRDRYVEEPKVWPGKFEYTDTLDFDNHIIQQWVQNARRALSAEVRRTVLEQIPRYNQGGIIEPKS